MNQVNTFDQVLSLNPDCHKFVTNYCHREGIYPTPKQLNFIKKAYTINVVGGELWSYANFFPMSKANFRKTIQRLKPIIEKVVSGIPSFYMLKGINMPYSVTKTHMGMTPRNVAPDFDKLLQNLKNQPPMMHDLRVHTRITGLYENILHNSDLKPNKQNQAFTIHVPINYKLSTTVNVYKDTMQVMVGCSQQPLPYSISGFLELSSHLSAVCEYLKIKASHDFMHEPISNWTITYFHFNRDGITIQSPIFNYTITDLSSHSVFYLKRFDDGTVKPRYEEHLTPHKTLTELSMGQVSSKTAGS